MPRLASTQAPVVFVFQTIWEPGRGYFRKNTTRWCHECPPGWRKVSTWKSLGRWWKLRFWIQLDNLCSFLFCSALGNHRFTWRAMEVYLRTIINVLHNFCQPFSRSAVSGSQSGKEVKRFQSVIYFLLLSFTSKPTKKRTTCNGNEYLRKRTSDYIT